MNHFRPTFQAFCLTDTCSPLANKTHYIRPFSPDPAPFPLYLLCEALKL
jgi:hypothetical protein